MAGNVFVEGRREDKAGTMFGEDVLIEVKGNPIPFVSRGGLKLDKAVREFGITLFEKTCMDVGASTGGFTDCMLQNGAKKVYAIDVGHEQMDKKLKEDNRVINLEGTNIKEVQIDKFEKVNFIGIDVSFISLVAVLDKAYELLKQNGEMVVLIKPQFEAGKEYINKNGVVKDKKVHLKVIEKIMLFASSLKFEILGLEYSPIKGSAGNIEYLLYLKKSTSNLELFSARNLIKQTVEKAHNQLKKE